MQITFDPLNEKEAAYVRDMLGGKIMHTVSVPIASTGDEGRWTRAQLYQFGLTDADIDRDGHALLKEEPAAVRAEVAATIAEADRPDVGALAFPDVGVAAEPLRSVTPSAAPLEQPAPLPAAADLFGTAPVAPPAGEASAPTVPSPPVPTAPPVAPAPSANALPVLPADAVDKHGLPWDERIHSGTRVKNADGSWRQRRGVDAALVKTVENELRALMAIPTRPGVTLGSVDSLVQAAATSVVAMDSQVTQPLTAVPAPPVVAPAVPAPPAPSAPAVVPSPPPAGPASGTGATPATAPAGPTDAGNVPPPPVPAPPTSAPATAPIPSPPPVAASTAAEPAAPLTFATMLRKVTDALAQGKIKETDVHAALERVGLSATQIGLLSARTDLIPAFDSHITSAIGAGHA